LRDRSLASQYRQSGALTSRHDHAASHAIRLAPAPRTGGARARCRGPAPRRASRRCAERADAAGAQRRRRPPSSHRRRL